MSIGSPEPDTEGVLQFHDAVARIEQSLQAGQGDAVLDDLDQLVEQHASNVDAWAYRGRVMRLMGDVDEAERCLLKAARMDPADGFVRTQLAWIAWVRGDQSRSKAILRRAIEAYPNDVWPPAYLAQQHMVTRQFAAAWRALQRAWRIDSSPTYVRRIRADLLANRGELDVSLTIMQEILDETPDAVDARAERALLLAHLGRPREAIADLDFVIRVQPHREYFFNRAWMRWSLGRRASALGDLERLLKIWSDEPEMRRLASQMAWQLGRRDRARELLEESQPRTRRIQSDLRRLRGRSPNLPTDALDTARLPPVGIMTPLEHPLPFDPRP